MNLCRWKGIGSFERNFLKRHFRRHWPDLSIMEGIGSREEFCPPLQRAMYGSWREVPQLYVGVRLPTKRQRECLVFREIWTPDPWNIGHSLEYMVLLWLTSSRPYTALRKNRWGPKPSFWKQYFPLLRDWIDVPKNYTSKTFLEIVNLLSTFVNTILIFFIYSNNIYYQIF